jgi:hypothetical protein
MGYPLWNTNTALNPFTKQRQLLPPFATRVFNVTSFGAVGNGSTDDTAAINAAITAAASVGGWVQFEPRIYAAVGPFTVPNGVAGFIGSPPMMTWTSIVTEDDWVFNTSGALGTVLVGNGTQPCFIANNTPNASPPSSFYANAVGNVSFINIGISGYTYGMQFGAVNNLGLLYPFMRGLWFNACTQWAVSLVNCHHVDARKIEMLGPATASASDPGNGLYIGFLVPRTTLQPGNSIYDNIVWQTKSGAYVGTQGMLIEAVAPAGYTDAIGDLICMNRVQSIVASNAASTAVNPTMSSSSTTITSAAMAAWPVGQPFQPTTTANGFTAGRTYFILTTDGVSAVTVATERYAASAITPTGSANITFQTYGMPNFAVVADPTSNINAFYVTGLDLEGASSAKLLLQRIGGGEFRVSSYAGTGSVLIPNVVARFSQNCWVNSWAAGNTYHDVDNNCEGFKLDGLREAALGSNNPAGFGINEDQTNAGFGLFMFNQSSDGGDLQGRNNGGNWLYPNTALGLHTSQNGATSITLNASQVGKLGMTGASCAITLPAVSTQSTGNLTSATNGMWSESWNLSNGTTQTVTSNSADNTPFNNKAGWTSVSIPPGQCARFTQMQQGTGSTYYWLYEPFNPQPSVSTTLLAQTGAVSSVLAYTPPATQTIAVSPWVSITAVTTDVLQVQLTWTDENGTSQSVNMVPIGSTTPLLSVAQYYLFPTVQIRAEADAITVKTVLTTTGGSIAYDIGATIAQVA